MKLVRPALALAVGAGLVLSGTAGAAASKPVCNLVKDDAGDGSGLLAKDNGLDILSADVSSNTKFVTVQIRLAGAPAKPGSTAAPEGSAFYFLFNAPGATNVVYLATQIGLTGTTYSMGDVEGSINTDKTGAVAGHIDGNNITMTVERGVFASLADVKPGVKLTNLAVESKVPVQVPGVGGLLEAADDASGTKAYTAGSASCLKPGS